MPKTSQDNNPAATTTATTSTDHPSCSTATQMAQGCSSSAGECQLGEFRSTDGEQSSSLTNGATGPCSECLSTLAGTPSTVPLKRPREESSVAGSAKEDVEVPAEATPPMTKKARTDPPKKKKAKKFSFLLKSMMTSSSTKSPDQERDFLRQSLGGGAFQKVAKI